MQRSIGFPGRLAALALATAGVTGCGSGGGSNNNNSGASGSTVSGTAAAGGAIANATIVIEDRNGLSRQSKTDANGHFAFSINGLNAPYLIQVANGLNGPLFSVATAPGTANVTPYAHLVLLEFYALQGTTPLLAYATPQLFEAPTTTSIGIVEEMVERNVSKWLIDQNINPESFDLITTPFTANGQGYDLVLDLSTVDLSNGTLSITDGATTQTSTFSAATTASGSTIDVANVVTGPAGSTASSDRTLVPIGAADPLNDALDSANHALDDVRNLVNTKGSALADTDLVLLLTTDALQDGEVAADFAADLATQFRGITIDGARVTRLHAFDTVSQVLDAEFVVRERALNVIATQRMRTQFKPAGGTGKSLIWGNQQLARVDGRLVTRVESTPAATVNLQEVEAQALAPTTTITSVTVTDDASVFVALDVPLEPLPSVRIFQPSPDPNTWYSYVDDSFLLGSGAIGPLPLPPVDFTFTFVPAAGAPFDLETTATGTTDEFIVLVDPAGHLLADAQLGSSLVVTWTPPQSFAIDQIALAGFVADGAGNRAAVAADERLFATSATTGHLSFPAQMPGGGTIVEAGFTLTITGPNGESSEVLYTFSG